MKRHIVEDFYDSLEFSRRRYIPFDIMTFAAGKNVYEKLSISIEFIELSMFF